MMRRKKVAVVQPVMAPGGGTEAVTAWTIEALKNRYDVSLVTFSVVSVEALNRHYGTQLDDGQFSIVRPGLPPLLKRTNRFLLLKDHLMMRYCKSAGRRYDLFIGVGGAMDFGARGIQYIALAPGSTLVKVLGRDTSVPAWYLLAKRAFMRLSELISASSQERIAQNATLVTSRWAGNLVERLYGIRQWEVVYPPVNVPKAKAPWSGRQNGFLCVARISPEKKIELAVEILKRVRVKGFDISLRIAGRQDAPKYYERIKRLCMENASWIHLDGFLAREELSRLMDQHKYGINAASDEPFGIALAEMVAAGCIVFVPDSGGQTEIVDNPELTYGDVDDAVGKIVRVLESEVSQESLRRGLDGRGNNFSTQAFCSNMRGAVRRFLAGG